MSDPILTPPSQRLEETHSRSLSCLCVLGFVRLTIGG